MVRLYRRDLPESWVDGWVTSGPSVSPRPTGAEGSTPGSPVSASTGQRPPKATESRAAREAFLAAANPQATPVITSKCNRPGADTDPLDTDPLDADRLDAEVAAAVAAGLEALLRAHVRPDGYIDDDTNGYIDGRSAAGDCADSEDRRARAFAVWCGALRGNDAEALWGDTWRLTRCLYPDGPLPQVPVSTHRGARRVARGSYARRSIARRHCCLGDLGGRQLGSTVARAARSACTAAFGGAGGERAVGASCVRVRCF